MGAGAVDTADIARAADRAGVPVDVAHPVAGALAAAAGTEAGTVVVVAVAAAMAAAAMERRSLLIRLSCSVRRESAGTEG